MKQSNYSEKLRNPLWQKKRLEILERDEWQCQACGDKNNTLMVHHLLYKKNKEPWDIENSSLITLCESCHEFEHSHRQDYEEFLLNELKIYGYLTIDLDNIQRILPFKKIFLEKLQETIHYIGKNCGEEIKSQNKLAEERYERGEV